MTNRAGDPARWEIPTVNLHFPQGAVATPGLLRSAIDAAKRASAMWNSPCSSARIDVGSSSERVHGAKLDGTNAIVFHRQHWCRNGRRREQCYGAGRMAVTTVYLAEHPHANGYVEIREADIEINGVYYDWFGDQPQKAQPPVSLESLLAHEFGHVLGFEHVCPGEERAKRSAPCPNASASIMTAAAHQGMASALKRPSPADLQALCEVYPKKTAGAQAGAGSGEEAEPSASSACSGEPRSARCSGTPMRAERASECADGRGGRRGGAVLTRSATTGFGVAAVALLLFLRSLSLRRGRTVGP